MVNSNSSLHFMLPGKRATVGGEEVVVAEESDASFTFKKQKISSDCLISTATTAMPSNYKVSMGGASGSGAGSVVSNGKTPMIGGGTGNSDIDEDLHSRQLAVYGRETMRRLFASNILISGMQGLGTEIGSSLLERLKKRKKEKKVARDLRF